MISRWIRNRNKTCDIDQISMPVDKRNRRIFVCCTTTYTCLTEQSNKVSVASQLRKKLLSIINIICNMYKPPVLCIICGYVRFSGWIVEQ